MRVEHGSKQRLRYCLIEAGKLLGVGIAYAIWVLFTGWYIPCPFRLVTGLKCPGCGISHYYIALLHGNLVEAYHENELVFVMMPFIVIYAIYRCYRYVVYNDKSYRIFEIILLVISLVIAIAFCIHRNL